MLNRIFGANRKRVMLLMLLLSLALRLAWISTLKYDKDYWAEEGSREAAVSMLQGKGHVSPSYYDPNGPPMYAYRVPGFALFLAGAFLLFGTYNYLATAILIAIMSTFISLLVFFIAKMLFDEKVAFVSFLAACLFPSFIYWSGFLSPDNLTVFLIALTVFFLLKSLERPSWMNYAFAGLSWGAASLVRPQILLYLPFFLIYLLLASAKKKEAIRKFAAICLFAVIPAAIWTARNYRVYHQLVPMETLAGEAFFVANNPRALESPAGFADLDPEEFYRQFKGMTDLEVSKWYWRNSLGWIRANPSLYLKLVGDRFLRYWRLWPHLGAGITGAGLERTYSWKYFALSIISIAPAILLGITGMVLSFKYWRKTLLLYLLIFQFSSTSILVRVVLRYRESIMPYMIIFASYTLWFLWEKITAGKRKVPGEGAENKGSR